MQGVSLMKTQAFYVLVFGVSLSSCQTLKGPQELVHSQPELAPIAQTKTQVSVKKEEPKHNFFQNLFPKKQPEHKVEKHASKGASFFGEIWIRQGGCLQDRDGQTLHIVEDDSRDDDPDALSYSALKRKYGGRGSRKSSGDQRVYKIVWKPCLLVPRKLKDKPSVLPLEQSGPLP